MKVCLTTRYFDFTNAGIGRVASETLRGILNNGHQVIPISTNSTTLQGYMYYSQLQLPDLMPKNADVYHAITPVEGLHFPKRKPQLVSILDLIPILYPERTGAGIGYNKILNKIGTGYFEYCVKQCIKKADKVTTLSDHTKQEMCYRYGIAEENVVVTRLGIRADLFPLAPPEFTPIVETPDWCTKTYGYIGQLDKRKRVDLLVQGFRANADKHSRLLIAGAGRDRDKLVAMAGDDKRIKFLGFIDDNQLCDFYNTLDRFVFPTWAEGYGLPPVEAMACGKPVIVMNDAYIPNDVKERCHIARTPGEMFWPKPPLFSQSDNLHWAYTHRWENYTEQIINTYKEIT